VDEALQQIADWPAPFAAAGVLRDGDVVATRGAGAEVVRWASVTKLVTTLAALVAAEEGVIDLDEAAGPAGATVRHLLAHASGLPFEPGAPTGRPGQRRVYSNVGFETLAEHIAVRADMPFADYLGAGVLQPLGMHAELRGSPAADLHGSLDDLLIVAFGRFDPNDWGLGFELRDDKSPHWTGSRNSPRTFGHFGGSGTFLWVDPEAGLALGVLTNFDFGDWAKEAWPRLSDAVLGEEA
jgi:CubicO group peptidase (beta-lactamase class C family)